MAMLETLFLVKNTWKTADETLYYQTTRWDW
jgi:hypothetical protein